LSAVTDRPVPPLSAFAMTRPEVDQPPLPPLSDATLVSGLGEAVSLAVAIVHECAQIRLGGLPPVTPGWRAGDAPWRDDPRPPPGLVQGVYAFVDVAGFRRPQAGRLAGVTAQPPRPRKSGDAEPEEER
jgi:hypothetical protein